MIGNGVEYKRLHGQREKKKTRYIFLGTNIILDTKTIHRENR